MIVVFSGMDGAGKSTQIDLLFSSLKLKGKKPIIIWSRGGYTPGFIFIKKAIRKLLGRKLPSSGRNETRRQMISNPLIERIWLLLAIFDLIILYGLVIRFYSISGKTVICDRYIDDTFLDFSLNFPSSGFDTMWLWKILRCIAPDADILFLFKVPVSVSQQRSKLKDEPFPDDKDTLNKRMHGYSDESIFSEDKYNVIDGRMPIVEIQSIIDSCILSHN